MPGRFPLYPIAWTPARLALGLALVLGLVAWHQAASRVEDVRTACSGVPSVQVPDALVHRTSWRLARLLCDRQAVP